MAGIPRRSAAPRPSARGAPGSQARPPPGPPHRGRNRDAEVGESQRAGGDRRIGGRQLLDPATISSRGVAATGEPWLPRRRGSSPPSAGSHPRRRPARPRGRGSPACRPAQAVGWRPGRHARCRPPGRRLLPLQREAELSAPRRATADRLPRRKTTRRRPGSTVEALGQLARRRGSPGRRYTIPAGSTASTATFGGGGEASYRRRQALEEGCSAVVGGDDDRVALERPPGPPAPSSRPQRAVGALRGRSAVPAPARVRA